MCGASEFVFLGSAGKAAGKLLELSAGAVGWIPALPTAPGALSRGDYISQSAPRARKARGAVSLRTRVEVRWRARGELQSR